MKHKVLSMEEKRYQDDLKEIKEMMSRSSKFISLSGLSGIFAGVVALVAAWFANRSVYEHVNTNSYKNLLLSDNMMMHLVLLAVTTLIIAIGGAIYFTQRKAKKNDEPLWNPQSKRLVFNLMIPLVTGGILVLILLSEGYLGMGAPLTLIFYGLGLVNASKYTFTEIRGLGLAEIALGLLAMEYIGSGLLFWAIGFGVLHIIYGAIMQVRYK